MSRPLPLKVVLPALALALAACSDHAAPTPPAPAAAGERLAVRPETIADLKTVAATVATKRMGEARARIGGTLVSLAVKEGDQVREGQMVGVVSDRRLKLVTGAYDAQVAAAAAEAGRARAELTRINTLYEQGIYAKARLEQAQAAARSADGLLDAARAQRAASAETVAQGAVLAPSSGRVLHAETPVGSVVTEGQSIATITAGQPLLRVEIPEAQARALKVGDRVPIVAEDLPGAPPVGVIQQVYPSVTGGRVVADISAPGMADERVGQRVRVRIKVGERQALVIPRRFVATRYGVDFVRVLGAGGQATDVAVQVAEGPSPDRVELLSGLAAGDTVLAPGAAR
jgi:RND family efflux transporter MFP subunit